MRFLVLYEELATYFLNCLNHLAKQHNCQILVIMKQINPVAPFDFGNTHPNITLIERETLQSTKLEQLISEFKPDFTYISGWLYKPYLHCIRKLKLKQVIMGFDNQYNGSVRQKIGALYFRMHYKPIVHAAFVPGNKQSLFARKLGFKEKAISKNVYCCDYELYSQFAQQSENEKARNFPKRFLFVGRYVPEKGIQLLWECFTELQNEEPNEMGIMVHRQGTAKPT
jgi:glycosyltransferase involved in cell wall biosynthesis